jgi:hypothetical protein
MSNILLKYVGKVSLTLTRYNAGSYINGLWVNGSTTTPVIQANVQPLKGEEILDLPEGQRDKKAITLYTASLIKAPDESAQTRGDVFTFDGDTYEVKVVRKWSMGVRDHYQALACRVDE